MDINIENRINQGYTIIQTHTCSMNKAIVLAHSRTAPEPYVTWIARYLEDEIQRRYDFGHYSCSMQNASVDFVLRSHEHDETLPRNDILDYSAALQSISYNDWRDVTEHYSEEAIQAAFQNQKFMAREYIARINDNFSLVKHSLVQGLVDSQGDTIECSTIDEMFFVQNDLLGKRDKLNHAETRSSNILISAHGFRDVENPPKRRDCEISDEELCR